MLLLLLPLLVSAHSRSAPPTELTDVKSVEPPARCKFSVHKDGPGGEPVSGTALDVQLFYSIRCERVEGFCLIVSNCTVSADEPGFKPYAIIDQNGCTLEPSLYEDIRVHT
uniref:ZP domain-containing protein n=1 Tax=Heterorhabditis bacteriophora TaxID=37862 RepID=A0A1I7XU37_HETBA